MSLIKFLNRYRPAQQPSSVSGAADFELDEIHHDVGSRFQKIVERYPERVAVESDNATLTYRDLFAKALRISHEIISHPHAGKTEPVAVMSSHSEEMVVLLIGVTLAGRPYLFLDPGLPEERLKFVFKDSGASMILMEPGLMDKAVAIGGSTIISSGDLNENSADAFTRVQTTPDAPFCINYTSGTTSQPRGVVRSQRALLGNIRNMTLIGGITPADRLCCLISPGFGAAAMDIFGSILNGACVLPFNVRRNGTQNLPQWLREKKVTYFHAVPTLFRSLISQSRSGEGFPSVRWVLLGGERVYRSDFELFKAWFSPSATFQNVLGMTEGAGILCSYVCDRQSIIETIDIPVGFSVDGKEVFVGDENGNPLPAGERGGIIVKSELVSDGYLSAESEGKETFRSSKSEGGGLLLFTGDLGEVRPSDGALFWRGRRDERMKISGHRISPAEVELALLQRGEVAEAAVTAEQFGIPGEQGSGMRLIGWVVATEGSNPDSNGLRRLLAESLSPDSVPARFIFLSQMPLLPNGKIDRKALSLNHPAAQRQGVDLKVSARTKAEARIISVFESVLGLSPVFVYDHFFEIGGDSLAALNALGALTAHFGFELTSDDLIRHPTAASLAEAIPFLQRQVDGRSEGNVETEVHSDLSVVAFLEEGALPPLVLCPGGQGSENELLVFVRVLVQAELNRPVFGLRFSAFEKELPQMTSLGDLAEAMVKELTKEELPDGWVFVGECGSGALSVEIVRQLSSLDPPKSPSRLLLLDARSTEFMEATGMFNEARLRMWEEKRMKDFFRLLRSWESREVDVPVDLMVNRELAEASDDPTLGWQRFSRKKIKVHVVDGDHLSYIRENAGISAKKIREILAQV